MLLDLRSSQLADLLSDKLQVQLSTYPSMVTVRGHCRKTDGKIHADSSKKQKVWLLYCS